MDEKEIDKLKFVYEEACKSHEQQQRDIEHINNKFNWIIVLNTAALFFVFSIENINKYLLVSLIFFAISLIFSVLSLWARTYKRGPKLTEMMEKIDWSIERIAKNTNISLIKNVDLNYAIVRELKLFLKISIAFNVFGIIVLIINYLNVC